MRRSRLQYTKPSPARGNRSGRGKPGYVPYGADIDRGDRSRGSESRTSFFCDVCKQQMSSKDVYLSHCDSAFHKENESKVKKIDKDNMWCCRNCDQKFPTKVAVDQHCLLVRHQPLYRTEGMPKVETTENQKDQSPLRKIFSFGPLKPPNYCDICQIDCLSPSNLRIHLQSWRHRAALDNKRDEDEDEKSTEKIDNILEKTENADNDMRKVGTPDTEKRTRSYEGSGERNRNEKGYSRYDRRETDRERSRDRDARRRSRNISRERSKDRSRSRSRDRIRKRSNEYRRRSRDRRSRERYNERSGKYSRGRSRSEERDDRDRRGYKQKRRDRSSSSSRSVSREKEMSKKDEDISIDENESTEKIDKTKKHDQSKAEDDVAVDVDETEESKDTVRSEPDTENGRKIQIQGSDSNDDMQDLRHKLNKGKNIVITKKVNDDNIMDAAQSEDRIVSEVKNPTARSKEDDTVEGTIQIRQKSDILMRNQLLKEHNIEILRYKEAEDEYKRLCLEENFLKRRLALFRADDPRKDNDLSDLIRIERAIREVREELEIRDMMIQEKERFLIVLKNRMEERIPQVTKEGFSNTDPLVEQQNSQRAGDTSNDSLIVGQTQPGDTKILDQMPSQEKSNSDLRLDIERERLLRKLGTELDNVDPGLRERILDALHASESASARNADDDKSELQAGDQRSLKINENMPTERIKDTGPKVKTKESLPDNKIKQEGDDLGDSSFSDIPANRNSSKKRRDNALRKDRERVTEIFRESSEAGKKRNTASPVNESLLKRHRPRSSSADHKGEQRPKAEKNMQGKGSTAKKEEDTGETAVNKTDQQQNIHVVSKIRTYMTGLDAHDDSENTGVMSAFMVERFADRVPVRKELLGVPNQGSPSQSSRPREQFALWKSVKPDDQDDRQEDIWDTALGPGKDAADDVAVDIFGQMDDDVSDYRRGKLHTLKPLKKELSGRQTETPAKGKQDASSEMIPFGIDDYLAKQTSLKAELDSLYPSRESRGFLSKQPSADPLQSRWTRSSQDSQETANNVASTANQNPRGILKRGILKKPTETFKEKSESDVVLRAGGSSNKGEKDRGGSAENEKPEYGVSEETEKDIDSQQRKDTDHVEETGNVSAKDLEKVNFIIESFKKQYGSEWDSSQIEAELRMVLQRQHLARGTMQTTETQQIDQKNDSSIPGMDKKASDGQSRQMESNIRQLSEAAHTQHAQLDREPVSVENIERKQTLFPIKIPVSAESTLKGMGEFAVGRNEDLVQSRMSSSRDLLESSQGESGYSSRRADDWLTSKNLESSRELMHRHEMEANEESANADDIRKQQQWRSKQIETATEAAMRRAPSMAEDIRKRDVFTPESFRDSQERSNVIDYFHGREAGPGRFDSRDLPGYRRTFRGVVGDELGNLTPDQMRRPGMDSLRRFYPNRGPGRGEAVLLTESREDIDPRESDRDVGNVERYRFQPPWKNEDDRVGQFGIIHSERKSHFEDNLPRESSKDGDLKKVADIPTTRDLGTTTTSSFQETRLRESISQALNKAHQPIKPLMGYQSEELQTEKSSIPTRRQSYSDSGVRSLQQQKEDGWDAAQQSDRSTRQKQSPYTQQAWEGSATGAQENWSFPSDKPIHERQRNPQMSSTRSAVDNYPGRGQRLPSVHRYSPVSQENQDDKKNLFKYIYKTTNEQVGNGMFHCFICNTFLDTETDRSMHAYSDSHVLAIRKNEWNPMMSQFPSTSTQANSGYSARGHPAASGLDSRRFQPRSVTGQRMTRPIRPYSNRGGNFSQRGPSRPSGPY